MRNELFHSEQFGPDRGGPRPDAGNGRRTEFYSPEEMGSKVIMVPLVDDPRVDSIFRLALEEVEEIRERKAGSETKGAFDGQFSSRGLQWYKQFSRRFETNEEEILATFANLSDLTVDQEDKIQLSEFERIVLTRAAQFKIRQYAAEVLHRLTVDYTATAERLDNRIRELDRLLGPTFQNSDVKRHYENAKLVIRLWRIGEKAAADPSTVSSVTRSEVPHVETKSGTILSWVDVLYMNNVYEWYQGGFVHYKSPKGELRPLEQTERIKGPARTNLYEDDDTATKQDTYVPMRLLDVMTRLDKSDDDLLYVDRRTGFGLKRRADGRYESRESAILGQIVDIAEADVGEAWLTRAEGNRVAVKMIGADGSEFYYFQDKLMEEGLRPAGELDDVNDYYVDINDLVDPYNYGVSFEEKINPDLRNRMELESLAVRLADGLGEHIRLSDAEQKRIRYKSKEVFPALPKTPKEDKATDWGIRHKGIWWTFMLRSALSMSDVYPDLPETTFYTRQVQKPTVYKIRRKDGSTLTIPIHADKRGDYRSLVGTSWTNLAQMTEDEFRDFALRGKSQNPLLVYERSNSQLILIKDIIKKVRAHGRLQLADIDEMSSTGESSLRTYSPLVNEVEELTLRFIRDVTVAETQRLQVIDKPFDAAKLTNELLRKNFAKEELLAYKFMAVRIPEDRLFYKLDPDQRARLLLNELWTADEAIIRDPIVGYDEWKKRIDQHYTSDKVFLGGVAFERWLLSNKLFKSKGITDSTGVVRGITIEEFYKWSGIEMHWDKFKALHIADGESRTMELWRRRLRIIGSEQRPTVPSSHPDYAAQSQEYKRWLDYRKDPHHGVDPEVAKALVRWMNTQWPLAVSADWDALDVLPPMIEEGDLLRDKYKALDYILEWFYPNREWRSPEIVKFVRDANRRKAPDELVRPDLEERIFKEPLLGSQRKYRWGWLPNRQPLNLWQAYTEMNNGTRLEFAPDTKHLAKIIVDKNDQVIDPEARTDQHIEIFRIGAHSYRDPVLESMGINRPGYVTYNTLLKLPRRYARSVEAIEYGGGRFIPPKAAGYGIHRRPMELNKHSLQLKIPSQLVEKSLAYQAGVLYQDVISGMGAAYIPGDPESEKLASAKVEERFDKETWSNKIGTIVDSYFTYTTLKDQGKISESDYIGLLCLSGAWFQFRVIGKETRPDGLQGGNFIELLERIGVEDPQLSEFMKRRDEQARKMLKDATRISGYFLQKNTLGVDFLFDKISELRTTTLRTFFRQAAGPAAVTTLVGLPAAVVLENMATNNIMPALHTAPPLILFGGYASSAIWGIYSAMRIRAHSENGGRINRKNEYLPSPERGAAAEYSSFQAHLGGYAAYDYPGDDLIKGAENINKELTAVYTNPWMKRIAYLGES